MNVCRLSEFKEVTLRDHAAKQATAPAGSSRADLAWQTLVNLTGPTPKTPEDGVDWDLAIDLAQRHKSVLLFARGLHSVGDTDMPTTAQVRLKELARSRCEATMWLAQEAGRLSRVLDAANIPASVIKGAPLSWKIHGDVAMRDIGDVDIFVPEECVGAAAAELEKQGYQAEFGRLLTSERQRTRFMRGTNQIEYLLPLTGLAVELHWRWQKVDGLMPNDKDRIWADDLTVPGIGEVTVPDDIEHFIYLCTHGLAHGWTRLKWLNDIRWTIHNERLVHDNWQSVVTRARALGMTKAVATAVLVACGVDKRPPPKPLAALISEEPNCEILAATSFEQMMETARLTTDPPAVEHPKNVALGLLRYCDSAGVASPKKHMVQLRLLLLPSPRDLLSVDLPRGFGAVYLVMKVLRALRRILSP